MSQHRPLSNVNLRVPDAPQALPELAPCPFCGGSAGILRAAGTFIASCSNFAHGNKECAAWRLWQTEAEAIAAWNRRASSVSQPLPVLSPEIRERIDRELGRARAGLSSPSGPDTERNWRVAYIEDVSALRALLDGKA